MFKVTASDPKTKARVGILQTAHGMVNTPAFMPVGTQGTVKTLTVQDLKACGIEIVLSNVYHLSLRPGQKILEMAGGLHRFMAWEGPILTDSGGYQVFSLASLRKVTDEGVIFSSHVDGAVHRLTPEGVIEFQRAIGSDIVIPLDECVPYPCERTEAEVALNRTIHWAQRSKTCFRETLKNLKGSDPSVLITGEKGSDPLLFGIVQGATYRDLRKRAVEAMAPMRFDGYAMGGFSVGEPRGLLFDLLPEVAGSLPQDRPRYLMGMGEPLDVVEAVACGVDLFDCVIPTRHGRNGLAYTWGGRLNLKQAAYTQDSRPVEADCECEVCRTYSRMYIRHLFQTQELLAYRLLSFHNVWFYSKLMSTIRQAVAQGQWDALRTRLAAVEQPTVEGMVQ